MESDKRVAEQLGYLKAMTIRTGILHEAQVLQLQMWPMVVFPKSSDCRLEVDTKKHNVKIILFTDKKIPKKKFNQGQEILQAWMSRILWDDTQVEIEVSLASPKEVKNVEVKRRRKKNTRRV